MPCKCSGGKSACVCRRDSYSDTHHSSKATCFSPRPTSNSPGAVCSCSGHVFLSACTFHSASDLSPAGRHAAHLNLNVRGFYPSNFPHGAGIQTDTGDLTRVQEANHIHITVSHGIKIKNEKKKRLGKTNSHGCTQKRRHNQTRVQSTLCCLRSSWRWALEEGKAVA